jgi:hypothetical protein
VTCPLTYDLAEAAERIGGVSEKWLATQLRQGKLPGRKVGRHWRMTQSDIEAAVELFGVRPQAISSEGDSVSSKDGPAGLTKTSRRRLAS